MKTEQQDVIILTGTLDELLVHRLPTGFEVTELHASRKVTAMGYKEEVRILPDASIRVIAKRNK